MYLFPPLYRLSRIAGFITSSEACVPKRCITLLVEELSICYTAISFMRLLNIAVLSKDDSVKDCKETTLNKVLCNNICL